MKSTRRLWTVLGITMLVSFSILGYLGREIYLTAPPIPEVVRSESGEVLFTGEQIRSGQQVWQSIGGHQLGSIWGHGSYVAPDWTADWLHREAMAMLDARAERLAGTPYSALGTADRAALQAALEVEIRANTLDPETQTVTVSADRAAAIRAVTAHYDALFSDDPAMQRLREQYAIQENPVPDAARRQALAAFIHWSAWSAVTNRPGQSVSYTSNWPHEPLVGNTPTSPTYLWTFVSILLLIAGIGALVWYHAATSGKEPAPSVPDTDPLLGLALTRLDARQHQVLRAGRRPVPDAGRARRHHRALRGRRPGLLRDTAVRDPALLADAHLAHAARRAVDRHGLARHRLVHRARRVRTGAGAAALRGELPVYGAA